MDKGDRRREWEELGLDEAAIARLERYRAVPQLGAAGALRMEARLQRVLAPAESLRAIAYLAWTSLRLNPGTAIGGSAGLMGCGAVLTTVHPSAAPALWAIVAPWTALALAVFGQQPATGALGEWTRQAPVRWGRVRAMTWLWLAAFDVLLLWGITAGMGPLTARTGPLFTQWLGPFLVTLAVALGLDAVFPPRVSRVALAAGLIVNSLIGLMGVAAGRAMVAPIQTLLALGGPLMVPIALAAVVTVIAVEIRRPAYG